MAEYVNLKIAIEDRVGLLTIDHPPANAFNMATLDELDRSLDELLADDEVKVIVITGAGQRAFVAGLDLKEAANILTGANADAAVLLTVMQKGQRLFDRLENATKPVIAAMNALALGGGLELAMACHIRILSDQARVGSTESNLGLIPGWGGSQRLPRLVGMGRALELMLTGDMIDAQEAFRLGLVNKVVPADQVLPEALNLAKKIAAKSKLTNEAILCAAIEGVQMPLQAGLQHELKQVSTLIGSHDLVEGIQAFVQKRPPKFTDR